VIACCRLGSSISLRSFVRLGSAVSVVAFSNIGASLALRSILRLGASLAVIGRSRVGASLSLLAFAHIGASISLRSYGRLGASMAICELVKLGSALSLRSMARVGSAFSIRGISRSGRSVSLMSLISLGSSVSLRSFSRLGSAVSVLDFANFGSSLAVRSDCKIAGSAYTYGKLKFNSNTYIGEANSALETYVAGNRVMSLTTTGGTLHGMWMADTVVAVSDRRLKDNIKPITDTLLKNFDASRPEQVRKADKPPVLSWVLRQLRPVSYTFKQGSDAKNTRFGFIADEMQKVLPQVVRELPHQEGQKMPGEKPKQGIVYPDLIAVLAAMMRELSSQVKDLKVRVQAAEREQDRVDKEDPPCPFA